MKGFLKLFCVFATTVSAYIISSCDSSVNEYEMQSYSKRSLSSYGEEGEGNRPIYAIYDGVAYGVSADGKFNVTVSWTRGYITGEAGSFQSVVSAQANPIGFNCTYLSTTASWTGFYHVHGTIYYKYMKTVILYDDNGNKIYKEEETSGSTFFDIDPSVYYLDPGQIE